MYCFISARADASAAGRAIGPYSVEALQPMSLDSIRRSKLEEVIGMSTLFSMEKSEASPKFEVGTSTFQGMSPKSTARSTRP